jgi:hypothetical protein
MSLIPQEIVHASITSEARFGPKASEEWAVIRVRLDKKYVGLRWYAFASGQFAVPNGTDLLRYCAPGADATRITSGIVKCSGAGVSGSEDVEYHTTDKLGRVFSGKVYDVANYTGYERETSTLITGQYQPYYQDQPFEVWIPTESPKEYYVGPNRYRSVAPIASVPTSSSILVGEEIGVAPPHVANFSGTLVLDTDGTPLASLAVDESELKVLENGSYGQIVWSSPPVDRPDRLTWTAKGQSPGLVAYQTVEPGAQNRSNLRTFLAGIAVSLASAALLLLLEQYLAWRRLRT